MCGPLADQSSVQIRWMIRRDMTGVLDIEQQSFKHHWKEDDFLKVLRQRNCIGMVAERTNPVSKAQHIVGFMVYELQKTRIDVLNFAVEPVFRRIGIGKMMVDKLVAKLGQQRRQLLTLKVRETNLEAQLFFRSQGFMAMEVLRNYYEDSQEDAYQMEYLLFDNSESLRENAPFT